MSVTRTRRGPGAANRSLRLDPRRPLRLDGADRGFVVTEGYVDIFIRSLDGPRRPLLRVEAGGAIRGLPDASTASPPVQMLAVGGPGCHVLEVGRDAPDAGLATAWAEALAAALGCEPSPSASAADLDAFDKRALAAAAVRIRAIAAAEGVQLRGRIDRDVAETHRLLGGLARIIAPHDERLAPPQPSLENPLLAACGAVGAAMGLSPMRAPDQPILNHDFRGVAEIARVSHLRVRQTLLRLGWWRQDVGPLVAWLDEDRRPVALLPVSPGRYDIFDPSTGVRAELDETTARALSAEAASFYRPLPAGDLTVGALIRWMSPTVGAEIWRILFAATAAALAALAAPALTGVIIDQAISHGELGVLAFCALALTATALASAGFQVLQSVAVLRLGAASDGLLQAAIIDRLLRLPVGFFANYSAGELSDRLTGIEAMRRAFTGRLIGGLLAGVFSLFSFGLMFVLDARLAWAASGLGLAEFAVTVGVSVRRLRHARGYFDLHGKGQGFVLQALTGIGKLRVAAATTRAMAMWASRFAEQMQRFIASRRAQGWLTTVNATFPILASLTIFAMAGPAAGAEGSGRFLAFFAAFGLALAAIAGFGASLGELLVSVPHMERLWPILSAQPEVKQTGGVAAEITGAIELKDVTFGYTSEQRPVLDKLSLRIEPGEFVALVGPSGGGKSTIFRLLLGFERPRSGAILYDGQPIEALDVSKLRRQVGVVLQDGRLITGSLYENLCGALQLPVDQVWDALRKAGLEADMEMFPMGLHTVVTEGTSQLSGGQRQRFLIARALIHRPRLLLFDEATSALDNRTQALVTEALAGLSVTRVVIAHRLSTIRDADRILVIDGGAVVQEGTFETLSVQPGLFADLARRQLI